MKQVKYIATALVLLVLASCTKIIDVNINDAPPKVAIVGKINNDTFAEVKVNKSVEIDKNNNFPDVANAKVLIKDDAGNSEMLPYVGDGLYRSATLKGVIGRTYTLEVTVDGELFTSTSTMPALVPVDSIGTRTFSAFGSNSAYVVLHYTDPVVSGNNYRAVLYVNDTLIKDIFIEDDIYINGNTREAVLFSDEYEFEADFLTGEKVKVVINCIDRPVYEYFLELIEVDGSADVASPSNPKSNITGGALGYFTAQTVSVLERTLD